MKKTNIYFYSGFSIVFCIIIYILLILARHYDEVSKFGLSELALVLLSLYIVIPIYSIISGIIQRIFIKQFKLCFLIYYITTCVLLHIVTDIDRNLGIILIASLIGSLIFIISSFVTKGVTNIYSKNINKTKLI